MPPSLAGHTAQSVQQQKAEEAFDEQCEASQLHYHKTGNPENALGAHNSESSAHALPIFGFIEDEDSEIGAPNPGETRTAEVPNT